MINFATVVDRNADRLPADIAVSETDRQVTYAELRSRDDALSSVSIELGVGRGDIIGVLLDNHIEFVETMFAAN